MILATFLDHDAQIWRPTVTLGPRREEVRSYAKLGGEVRAGIRRPTARVGDAGPGLAPIGERVFYFQPEVDVEPRDIIELLSGPDAPGTWEVDSPPTRPRGHHVELTTRHWLGVLE